MILWESKSITAVQKQMKQSARVRHQTKLKSVKIFLKNPSLLYHSKKLW